MSLKIVLLLLSIISLKIPQKCKVEQSLSMQAWIESLHSQHHHEIRKKLREDHSLFPIIQTDQPFIEYWHKEISKRIRGQHQRP